MTLRDYIRLPTIKMSGSKPNRPIKKLSGTKGKLRAARERLEVADRAASQAPVQDPQGQPPQASGDQTAPGGEAVEQQAPTSMPPVQARAVEEDEEGLSPRPAVAMTKVVAADNEPEHTHDALDQPLAAPKPDEDGHGELALGEKPKSASPDENMADAPPAPEQDPAAQGLDTAAAPIVPAQVQGLNPAATPFVPPAVQGLSAAAAPFVPALALNSAPGRPPLPPEPAVSGGMAPLNFGVQPAVKPAPLLSPPLGLAAAAAPGPQPFAFSASFLPNTALGFGNGSGEAQPRLELPFGPIPMRKTTEDVAMGGSNEPKTHKPPKGGRQPQPWTEAECMAHMRDVAVDAGLILEPGMSAIRYLKQELVESIKAQLLQYGHDRKQRADIDRHFQAAIYNAANYKDSRQCMWHGEAQAPKRSHDFEEPSRQTKRPREDTRPPQAARAKTWHAAFHLGQARPGTFDIRKYEKNPPTTNLSRAELLNNTVDDLVSWQRDLSKALKDQKSLELQVRSARGLKRLQLQAELQSTEELVRTCQLQVTNLKAGATKIRQDLEANKGQ